MNQIKLIKFIILFFLLLIQCHPVLKEEVIVENQICKLKKKNGENYLVCDENNKLKVYLKTEHIVKELNNCKKGVYQINNKEFTAIICKTNYGYEVIK